MLLISSASFLETLCNFRLAALDRSLNTEKLLPKKFMADGSVQVYDATLVHYICNFYCKF